MAQAAVGERAGRWHQIRSDAAVAVQATLEHDETDLVREIESFERDISKYEQQSSDPISNAMKHGIMCGGMAHQGLKQHIDLSISRLAT